MGFLRATLCVSILHAVAAGYAPSTPPKLPKSFCSEREGTVTASTGECMCRYKCEGAKCQSGQGMVWYAVKDCPTGCKCAPHPSHAASSAPPPQESAFGVDEGLCTEETKDDCGGGSEEESAEKRAEKAAKELRDAKWKAAEEAKKRRGQVEAADDEYSDDEYSDEGHAGNAPAPEEQVSLSEIAMDWLDDNARVIFGGVVVLVFACIILPTLVVMGGGSGGETKATEGAKKAKKGTPAAEVKKPTGSPAAETAAIKGKSD